MYDLIRQSITPRLPYHCQQSRKRDLIICKHSTGLKRMKPNYSHSLMQICHAWVAYPTVKEVDDRIACGTWFTS